MILAGLFAVLCWIVLLPLLYLWGTWARRWFDDEDRILRGVYLVAMGAAFLSYFIVALGTIGWLKPWPLLAGALSVALLRRTFWKDCVSLIREGFSYF